MRHVIGDSRQQATLLPDTLDDYIDENYPVRVIDAFVDTLDMKALDFSKAETQVTAASPIILVISSSCMSTDISIRSARAVGWRRNAIAISSCSG